MNERIKRFSIGAVIFVLSLVPVEANLGQEQTQLLIVRSRCLFLVPTRRVGERGATPRVASGPRVRGTQSVRPCGPTWSVGTRGFL